MIAITGATGRIGLRLVAELQKMGKKPIAIVRSEASARKLPKGVKFRIASLENGDGVSEALAGADAVVNLAGSTDTRLTDGQLALANISATSHLFHCLPPSVKNAVHVSSITIYGKELPHVPCDEFAHPNPDTPYARTKWAGERIARDAAMRLPVSVLRPAIVYGPSFEDGFYPMLNKLQDGSAKIIGNGENRMPLVHVDDVVLAIVLALKNPKQGLSVYNISSPESTQKEIYAMAASALGVNPPTKSIPRQMAKLLASANSFSASLRGRRTSFTPDMVDQLSADRAFDTYLAHKHLGWSPRITLKEGIIQTVKAYKRSKYGKNP